MPPLGKFLSPFQGFWQNAVIPGEKSTNDLKLEGLQKAVTVYYDEMEIPHIYADSDYDLHFTHGYLAAKDRLWQMDFLSRVVSGRLSEVLGGDLLETDRLLRRIGMKKMTQEISKVSEKYDELNTIIQAYTDGVNAYIESLSYDEYPIEFKLLNYEPELWTIEKSHLAYALLSQTLSMSEADLENTNAFALFGKDVFDLLFPEQLGNLDPIISKDRKWNFKPIEVDKPTGIFPLLKTDKTIEKPDPLNGSNNFAISPAKSANGHVLLANEPDLELSSPSIWHAVHLHNKNKNVMGVTVPGTPVILIGFNDSIAWGVTNSPRDQVDWYSITYKNKNRSEYLYNNHWFPTSKVVEEIKIRGEESYFDTIVYTHHGPVVYDQNFKSTSQNANYAMRWIAHDPSTTLLAMSNVNKSKNYAEFTSALKDFKGPPQNFIFGSVNGDVAMWLPGKFPVKWKEQGKFLMDGSNPEHEWKNYIPYDHLMNQKNPERGFVSSANQHQVDSIYPYYVYDHHYEYFRGRRINDRLSSLSNMTPKDMIKLQNDNYNYLASEILPFMISQLDSNKLNNKAAEYVELLKTWDYFSEPNRKAPTAFQLWWNYLYEGLWDEFDTAQVALDKPNVYVTSKRLLEGKLDQFTNLLSTRGVNESAKDLIEISFNQALEQLIQMETNSPELLEWAKFKNTSIKHYLKLPQFSRADIAIGGYKNIVNAASGSHGPSWRMVVELDPAGTKAWGVYPGSQSGNPGNPNYNHMVDRWATSNYYPLLFGQDISNSPLVTRTIKINP